MPTATRERDNKSKTSSTPVVATTATASQPRHFEFVEGSSNKFWEVSVSGCDLTTAWGKIGTSGQSKTKTFATAEKAQAEMDKLIAEKTDKGYEEN